MSNAAVATQLQKIHAAQKANHALKWSKTFDHLLIVEDNFKK